MTATTAELQQLILDAIEAHTKFIRDSGRATSAASSAYVTSVNSAATSAMLIPANGNRSGVMITNTDANALYVKYGITASTLSFTVAIPANGYWEMPKPIYIGQIDGIWAADGSGAAIITEM